MIPDPDSNPSALAHLAADSSFLLSSLVDERYPANILKYAK